ncbi:TlpA family protein disulfide reductase [Desulfomonile tiedjei]|uniref:Peroxiredoxin n=1 Tax=Desulfomonile tiedjei (strain ATCC 49306 / DSM 6799 / DCB-1) TaxID=706587 RepID=I4C7X8_DESTA|nr:TlpA disulfide reductase family protein [Desulfomonile tiedjei]AFM25669.1 Peroxiredoxin [Desulfomonile tiedjei DSM 6799]
MFHRKLFIFCMILSLGTVTGTAIGSRGPDRISNIHIFSRPDPAREMQLQDIHGKSVALSRLRGKIVILNFWKIDCPPCSMEKPVLERIYRKYASRGLEIVAVNLFDHKDDLRAYGQRGRFSFTLAYDPAQQFTTKRFAVGSGTQTTFIVNQHSQAIYEVSGVPTTYVIDRNGKVVANAVGMVNWEDPEESAFLESLLQPGATTVAAESVQSPELPGRHLSGDEVTYPERLAQMESDNADVFQQTQYRDSEPFPPVMAQQGPVQNPTMPSVTGIQPPQSPPPVRVAPPQQDTEKAQGTKRRLSTKQAKTPAPVPSGSRKPVPYQPGTAQNQPPVQTGVQSGSLPPLPAAIPYTPPRGQRPPAPPLVPDANGTVTARIPGGSGTPEYGSSLPPAQPLGGNPIGNFILDSFGHPSQTSQSASPRPIGVAQPPAQERTQQPASQQPAGVIQQIGQDFQNLGAGIRDTFSRIWPGR